MKRFACLSALPLLVAGCGGSSGDRGAPSPALPAGCQVTSVVAVPDPSVPASGFGFSAQSVIDAQTGSWSGSFASPSGPTTSASGSYALAGPEVDAVYSTPVAVGTQPVPASCPPVYQYRLSYSVTTGDGSLQESGAEWVTVSAPTSTWLDSRLPLAGLHGSIRPGYDYTRFDQTLLDLSQGFDGGWQGGLWWFSQSSYPGGMTAQESAQGGNFTLPTRVLATAPR